MRSKRTFKISRTKNVGLKLPKISLTKGYFGQVKGYMLGQFKGYICAVLGHFFLLRLGVVGHRGFTIVLNITYLSGTESAILN